MTFRAVVLSRPTRPTPYVPEAVGAVLTVSTIGGVVLAPVFKTGGGAWDNAMKHIEFGGRRGAGTHKAAVVGDTVGDPFKATAGPSLRIS